jgi:hypothetical protein
MNRDVEPIPSNLATSRVKSLLENSTKRGQEVICLQKTCAAKSCSIHIFYLEPKCNFPMVAQFDFKSSYSF